MAKRKIIWLRTAELEMINLMAFYTERNKSTDYSKRLYREINLKLKRLDFTIALPQKTTIENLFYITHNHISLFFVIEKEVVIIKFVTDERRNPKKIEALLTRL